MISLDTVFPINKLSKLSFFVFNCKNGYFPMPDTLITLGYSYYTCKIIDATITSA